MEVLGSAVLVVPSKETEPPAEGSVGAKVRRATGALAAVTAGGQATLAPVQDSAGSHEPVEARQTWVEGASASAGQAPLTPSQLSGASQRSTASRQTVAAGKTRQVPLVVAPVATEQA